MPAAAIAEVRKAVNAVLDAAPTWGGALDDDRRSAGEIDHHIVSADADIVTAILETNGHPLRSGYMAASGDLVYTGEVAPKTPDSIGEFGPVEIQIGATAGWVEGVPCDSEMEIRMRRENAGGIFGALAHNVDASPIGGFYNIRPPRLYFTGTKARIWIGAFTPNYAVPVCFGPDVYLNAIVVGAVARLRKEGDLTPDAFVMASQLFGAYMGMIRRKEMIIPDIELTQKAAA
jgi:hypothetical protein